LIIMGAWLSSWFSDKARSPMLQQTGRLVLYGFRPISLDGSSRLGSFVADGSPFVLKLLAHLVLAGVDFDYRPFSLSSALSSPAPPKGKMPYARMPDGRLLGDSQFIAETLAKSRPEWDLDATLDPDRRAVAHLVRRTLEESFYFNHLLDVRWRDDRNWSSTMFHYQLPGYGISRWLIRPGVIRSMQAQGAGRHSHSECEQMAVEDLRAVLAVLGKSPFFGGEKPCAADCCAYGFLANVLLNPNMYRRPGEEGLLEKLLGPQGELHGLATYAQRMHDKVAPVLWRMVQAGLPNA